MLAERTTLDAALEAHDAGLCVIRGRADGTKRPLGDWAQWQTQRPSREEVFRWFTHGHPALMVVCGAVSGVEMLELEGRAVDNGLAAHIDTRAHEQGLADLLDRIVAGYCERTPSGGLHLIYRVDQIEPNTRIARDATGQVLIETRGEGGVVMVAPSHGATHTTGLPWELTDGGFTTLATITIEERDALFTMLATFDEAGPDPAATIPPAPPKPVTHYSGGVVGPSWLDATVAHLAAEMSMVARLEGYGWRHVRDDARGALMCRPGKDEGISGRVNANGRLMNWSSSAPFTVATANTRPTFDQLDVIAAYEHRGDRQAAAKAVATTAGIMRTWQREQDTILLGKGARTPPEQRNDETGTTSATNLPEPFWTSRPELGHIRAAAHSRSRSADAVLGCILARIAALTHPCWRLPAIVGAESSIATYVALVGPSGSGKSSAKQVAMDLLPCTLTTIADDLPLGSGEGLMECYYDWVDEEKPAGGKGTTKVKRKVRDGAFLTLDEGQALADLGARKGSTLVATLRSAWTGATLGSTNASIETKRRVPAGTYTLGLVIGLQPTLAAALLDDAGGGLPQRFTWVDVTDPTIPDERPPWPGTLEWAPPPIVRHGDGLTVDNDIETEIRARDLARQRRQASTDPLDAHSDLVRLKVAACLALLAGRTHIDSDDWELAGALARTSRLVRTVTAEHLILEARQAEEARTATVVRREATIADSAATRAVDVMARAIARSIRKHDTTGQCAEGCARRCAHAATAARYRELATLDDAIDLAVRLRWIVADGGRLRPGEAAPA